MGPLNDTLIAQVNFDSLTYSFFAHCNARKSDDDSSPLLVAGLMPGGPAASLGIIAVDDELLSVNGEDVHFKPSSTVHDLLGYVAFKKEPER